MNVNRNERCNQEKTECNFIAFVIDRFYNLMMHNIIKRISAMVARVDSSSVTLILYCRLIISYNSKTSHIHDGSANHQSTYMNAHTIVQKFGSTHNFKYFIFYFIFTVFIVMCKHMFFMPRE